ncbi:hypothetical protein FAES_1205 [Fibrella aestuarina BUZ 2]|uniref:Lipocalin-like domain-containing protein n=1 Tax=Fibrella aestuarina BUZ 2 TaxID=1166018 RepID=I0K512_9BACT|nr:hypothetical protein [Fibrella aestuarina]CCG99215.1 hypothetical protein FAES_1205 [Fibrella aestuarina BUZ 2]
MKTMVLLVGLLGTLPGLSQSLVGTWKRTGTLINYQSGKTDDVQAMMTKSMPCTANITYEFTGNGLLKTKIPADCQQMMSAMAKLYADTRYSTSGNQITVVSPDPKLSPNSTYTYSVTGNTLIMTLTYADQPKMPNPTKAKTMVLTYQRQ